MDLDLMWGVFTRYRPMLDELFAEWSAQKENMAESRRTPDGRVLTEEEVAANDAPGATAISGRYVAPGAHATATQTFEVGSDEELDRLREIADERGVEYDKRWRGHRMREELGFTEDEDLPVASAAEPPAHAPGEGATASGEGGQDNPPGAGHTASGAGGQDNPARTGHTASGLGGQDNPTVPGTQARVTDQPRGQERQERGAAQARDKK